MERTKMEDLIRRQDAIDKAIIIPIAKIVAEDKVIYRKVVFVEDIYALTSVQPELLEHEAYIRGFEQGRTQGMINSQDGKK